MARLELTHQPNLRVYEVDPTAMHVPDHNRDRRKVVARQEKAWHGTADRKLCAPGFAAFAGSHEMALQALLRVIEDTMRNGTIPGIGQARRIVITAIGERNACGSTV